MQGTAGEQLTWLGQRGFVGRFQLVYWDPPFFSGKERAAPNGSFSDQWPSLQEYLNFIREHFARIVPFLSPTGFVVLHCDYHASHYLKILGDELMGYENFRNEVIWHYTGRRQKAIVRINSKHDSLLIWAKSDEARMNPIFDNWDRDYYIRMKKQQVHVDEDGREWIWGHKGKGQSHAYRIYLEEVLAQGRAVDSVWDIPIINTSARERVGYPTQKPVKLLERVVSLLTQPGEWVLDVMAGSGTTGVAAWPLERRVCLGDSNPEAVAITVSRLKNLSVNENV
ncbi:MAG: site-specific DNA-methyltransferase [Firmicutes bacterium]|nr:site-specific DNA-methyltransferase [Bacillota bacterium]MCL5014634.1 site-specific DNA-methyltransferase [Bacillota bacterium]